MLFSDCMESYFQPFAKFFFDIEFSRIRWNLFADPNVLVVHFY